MSFWDDLTHAISEIDDYVVGVGKGIASAFLDDGQLFSDPNAKKPKRNEALNRLTEDWYNDSVKSRELTFNVLDTPVNFVLNTQSKALIAKQLIQKDPQKYGGPNGWDKAVNDAHKLTFGKREGLAWYEQDPNRLQYGEAMELAKDPNAPIIKSFEERQQYWSATGRLDDIMWTTLASMLMYDPLNFVPGGQAKNVNKVRDIQNVIDALDAAKTTDEAMEVVRGFNWEQRLPIPQDVKMIRKDLLEAQKNEIRNLVDEEELAQIQREVTLTLTQKPENLLRRGTLDYSKAVAELAPMFKFYDDLPNEVKAWLPRNDEFRYVNLGNEVWGTTGDEIFRWIPKMEKNGKTVGNKWQLINVMPKHQPAFLKELIQEPYTRLPEDVGRDVKFYSDRLGLTKDREYIGYAAMPVEDTALLHLPIYRNDKISGSVLNPQQPNVRGATKEMLDPFTPSPFRAPKVTLSFDPKVTRFIEVIVQDAKGNPRKIQLAVVNDPVDGGVYHLDWYRRTSKSKPDIPQYTDEAVDRILANGLEKVKGVEARLAVASNLFNRLTPEQFKALKPSEQEMILKYSDADYANKLQGKDVVAIEEDYAVEMADIAQDARYNPDTGEIIDDLDNDSSISDYFFNGLDDNSVSDFADEFGDDISESFSRFEQGMNIIKEPRIKSNKTFLSEKKPIWVFDGKFRWDKVTAYSGTYVNHITGKRTKYTLDSKYKIVNPVEVSKGAVPRIVEAKNQQGPVYTFDADGELISFSELNSVKQAYDDNLLRATAEAAELQKRMLELNTQRLLRQEERLANLAAAGKTDDPEWSLARQIADENRIEELKRTDPYAYQSYMERIYGTPRTVTFGFRTKTNPDGSTRFDFIRTTQEIDGYGDFQKFVGEPIEEVVHSWDISKRDLAAINERMTKTGGIGTYSRLFKRAFLGEDTLDDAGKVTQPAKPIVIDYKDLDRFGQPRWASTVASHKPYLEHIDGEIRKAIELIAKNRAALAKYDPNDPLRAGTRDSLQNNIDMNTARVRTLTEYRTNVIAAYGEAMTDLSETAYRGRKVVAPTADYAELNFNRWIQALNYYGKTNVGLLDNLPVGAVELDAMRKSAIAKATETMKAEERLAEPVIESSNVIIHSGGAKGADTQFAEVASELGLATKAHSFKGHLKGGRPSLEEAVVHSQEELNTADELLKTINKKYLTNRKYPTGNTFSTNLLRRNYYQVKDSDAVIAVTRIDDKGIVEGGTAWAVYMGVEKGIPVHVFDYQRGNWYVWQDGKFVRSELPPKYNSFAGIGSRDSDEAGTKAIRDYLQQYKNVDAAPSSPAVLTTPEGILQEALRLSPGNKKLETLLNNFKTKQYGDEENDFLDSMLASVSVSKDGSKLPEEDLTGFETLLASLTGDKDAARIIDKQKSDFYKILDEQESLRQSSIRSENEKLRLELPGKIGDSADESQIPVIHSTKYPVVRNEDGSVSIYPAGHHRAGTDKAVPRASVHFTLETPVITNNGGIWSTDEIRIVSDLSSMIKDNKLPYTLRSDDTWWQRSPGKPIKITNAIVIRPVKDVNEKLPVIFFDEGKRDVIYQIKKNYTEKDRKEILKLAEETNLKSVKVGDTTVNIMNSESFVGYERNVLDVLSLQLAKKELGINTPPQTLGGWGLNNNDLEKGITFLQEKYNISNDIHRHSSIELLEKDPTSPHTKFYGGIEGMRYAALMGKFEANKVYGTIPGV